jgi:hypothetical protein
MHAHDLADLAALLAVHSEQLVAADSATMDRMLASYWKASRCRLDRWCRGLALATRHSETSSWTEAEIALVDEILVTEILSRVVAALAVAHDQSHSANESGPVARNIFNSHLDMKRRAMALVVAPHRDQEQADDFLALRRQCERWTDLLLAYLAPQAVVEEFAACTARVGDFAFDAREHLRSGAASDMAVTMIVAGMRSSIVRFSPVETGNADLNLDIATALVSGFAPDFFDAHGRLRSAWLERIRKVPSDSPVNLKDWWHLTPHGPHEGIRPARWRR